jgi:hypothetical protein
MILILLRFIFILLIKTIKLKYLVLVTLNSDLKILT